MQETLSQIAQRHYDAENMLRAGDYGFDEDYGGEWLGSGCSVGCFAHDAGYQGDHIDGSIHAFVAHKYGYPEWAVHLQDEIFEGLARTNDQKPWHIEFARAVEIVTDWGLALHKVHCAILEIALENAGDTRPQVQAVYDLHAACARGEVVTETQWNVAIATASAATSSQWSAAERSAQSAARSAASTRGVANAARGAAESAAWSAGMIPAYRPMSANILTALKSS